MLNFLAKAKPDRWHHAPRRHSLAEVYASVSVPKASSWFRRLLAVTGPGYLIAVGYMDPGNWATDIAGGSKYAYALLSAVLLSNFIAIFLQALSSKLGLATGRDLAQACRDTYSRPVSHVLWVTAQLAIVACDIAEVIGAAIALKLLFHLPLVAGVLLTSLDVLVILSLQHRGFRWIEALVTGLILVMMGCFAALLSYSKPDWGQVAHGFLPSAQIVRDPAMLYIALGILGATVMPHNLYLHSSIVLTRERTTTAAELKDRVRLAITDSTIALMLALFVNAAILILAAATFYRSGNYGVNDIQQAYHMLTPLVGTALAAPLFAIALLASGQNSTLTGTLAGQVILEGFSDLKVKPWVQRLVSRSLAIIPAAFAVVLYGEGGLARLLIFSQVILSLQLPFAVFPLAQITSDHHKMGEMVNRPWVKTLAYTLAAIIAGLNLYLVATSL
ncbi:MAG: Nramp family divalent metal transporter [Armatimonadetes bacterium]|nr:Nramp family divalent metal transporter [Armatimonadota bacterium]